MRKSDNASVEWVLALQEEELKELVKRENPSSFLQM
jgi:hypothetical protein